MTNMPPVVPGTVLAAKFPKKIVDWPLAFRWAVIGLVATNVSNAVLHAFATWTKLPVDPFAGTDMTSVPHFMAIIIISGLLIAPPLETLLFHLAYKLKVKVRFLHSNAAYIALCCIVFAYLHLPPSHHSSATLHSIPAAITVGLCCGFTFCQTYLISVRRQIASPYWTTAACHGLYNGALCLFTLSAVLLTGS